MSSPSRNFRIAVLELHKHSFGFAVFENPTNLLDWGVRRTALPSAENVFDALMPLLRQWNPTMIAFACTWDRKPIGKKLLQLLRKAYANRIEVRLLSPQSVKETFGRRLSRHDAAVNMSKMFPFLAAAVPRGRKLWQSEAYRMQAFGAISAGLSVISQRSEGSPFI